MRKASSPDEDNSPEYPCGLLPFVNKARGKTGQKCSKNTYVRMKSKKMGEDVGYFRFNAYLCPHKDKTTTNSIYDIVTFNYSIAGLDSTTECMWK